MFTICCNFFKTTPKITKLKLKTNMMNLEEIFSQEFLLTPLEKTRC